MVSQGILKYCLKGCLGDDQRSAVFKFFDVCAKLCAEKQASNVSALLEEINVTMVHLEQYMPVTIQVWIIQYNLYAVYSCYACIYITAYIY